MGIIIYFCLFADEKVPNNMSNPYFRFKQFTVWHDRCAMKVGTDGVLIGAWCDVDACRRILDVGCGTGLISLMIAQRTPDRTMIEGVEIDAVAAEQAAENTDRSPWKNRLRIHTSDFLDFATSTTFAAASLIPVPFNAEISTTSQPSFLPRLFTSI